MFSSSSSSAHMAAASKIMRLDARFDGEPCGAKPEPAFGVEGTVAKDVIPNRHCRPEPLTESRARRIAERDIPGGERHEPPAAGVRGTVSSGVTPKRHRFPSEVPHSA